MKARFMNESYANFKYGVAYDALRRVKQGSHELVVVVDEQGEEYLYIASAFRFIGDYYELPVEEGKDRPEKEK